MREYQRSRRALIRKLTPKQERNRIQQAAVKTLGGMSKYIACNKTKLHRFGVFAFAIQSHKRNGIPSYGYQL